MGHRLKRQPGATLDRPVTASLARLRRGTGHGAIPRARGRASLPGEATCRRRSEQGGLGRQASAPAMRSASFGRARRAECSPARSERQKLARRETPVAARPAHPFAVRHSQQAIQRARGGASLPGEATCRRRSGQRGLGPQANAQDAALDRPVTAPLARLRYAPQAKLARYGYRPHSVAPRHRARRHPARSREGQPPWRSDLPQAERAGRTGPTGERAVKTSKSRR
jgi:hypothetical protein